MNIFDLKDLSEKEEVVRILAEGKNVKIEKIISTGQTTDWQESEQNEFVILVQGEAEIEYFEDKGDTILINRGEKHRVSYTSKNPCCIWICIFFN